MWSNKGKKRKQYNSVQLYENDIMMINSFKEESCDEEPSVLENEIKAISEANSES